ncbi:hypothetical protein [Echinicola shivajiensis]|uniref:hypothetical protein n=1 Tax=Echinicola shivajiensis TaxID=1035916 RepID=UPI001BFCD4F9|nr:hypothetical protein [Echinicola shivajiensis]
MLGICNFSYAEGIIFWGAGGSKEERKWGKELMYMERLGKFPILFIGLVFFLLKEKQSNQGLFHYAGGISL